LDRQRFFRNVFPCPITNDHARTPIGTLSRVAFLIRLLMQFCSGVDMEVDAQTCEAAVLVNGHPNSRIDELLPWVYPAASAICGGPGGVCVAPIAKLDVAFAS
jgi:hypothetical protein